MRILTIFFDMLRADTLNSINEKVDLTAVDELFKKLGGTLFTECYSEGPDTARSLSMFWSGVPCYLNGCQKRAQYPSFFLQFPTFLDVLSNNGYDIRLYNDKKERDCGCYPPNFRECGNHNTSNNLEEFLKELPELDDQYVFLGIEDYHWALNDYGATVAGVKKGHQYLDEIIDVIMSNIDMEAFDAIIVFSDHGHTMREDLGKDSFGFVLGGNRTRLVSFIHLKGSGKNIVKNNKLCSITDFYTTIVKMCGITINKNMGYSIDLFSEEEHDFLCFEESLEFRPGINMNIDLWAVLTKEFLFCTNIKEQKFVRGSGCAEKCVDILRQECKDYNKYEREMKVLEYYKALDEIKVKETYTLGGKRMVFKSPFVGKLFKLFMKLHYSKKCGGRNGAKK